MSGRREETALGVARARFVEGLPRRTRELKGAIALLTASPEDARAREELRRRLHALFASAQVFRIEHLADGLKACIALLDAARESHRGLTDAELEELARVSGSLPELAHAASREGASIPAPPPRSDTFRAPEPSPEVDVVTALPTGPTGFRIPSVEDFAAPAKPPAKERQSVEEAVLRLATISPGSERVPETDDPFDAAVTTPGTFSAAPVAAAVAEPVAAAPIPSEVPEPASTRAARPVPPSVAASRIPVPRPRPVAPPPLPAPTSPRPISTRPVPKAPGSALPGLQTVVSVLVVDDAQSIAQVRGALPAERFEVLSATDPEEALRLARTASPDLVLVSAAVVELRDIDFVTRLRSDPLNGDVPLVLLGRAGTNLDPDAVSATGADDFVVAPIDPDVLGARIGQLCGLEGHGVGIGRLGDMTVAAISERIAEEVRRGLAESVDEGAELTVPLAGGSEVLAAAWAAIARVRAHVAEASHGRVRFRDLPRRGAPTLVGIADGLETEGGEGPEIALAGRKLLIADDDPAVLWFFTQVLKEAGAVVVEASDGVEALELARRSRPEVVLSDILMPRMDGMALCRELARDPALGAVPVILLSWKEDFLQRMRELRAGAHGYLRKEEGTAQILRRVREALRPRANLERMLRAGGEVRGRIEQLGIVPLIRMIAHERPDARLTVRDAHSLFEVDLRGGALVDVTRTAADGGFARGPKALPLLIGVVDGRFTVIDSDATVRPTIEGALDALLDDVATKLGAVVDAVSGAGLCRASEMELDPDALDALVASSPGRAGEIAEKLRAGMSPPALLLADGVEPQLLESVLVDLARRGGVRKVSGPSGEDRVAEALAERRRGLEALALQDAVEVAVAAEQEPLREPVRTSAIPEAPRRPSEATDLLAEMVSQSQELDALAAAPASGGGEVGAPAESEPVLPQAAPVVTAPIPPPQRPSVAPAPPTAKRPRTGRLAAWAALLVALGGIGYVVTRTASEAVDEGASSATTALETSSLHAAAVAAEAEPAAEAPAAAPAGAEGHVAEGEPRLYGRALPMIVSEQTAVGEGQGLLRVEADEPLEGVQLLVGDRAVGTPPLDIALDEGVHELAFRSGDQLRYRYVFIRAGESRIVPAP